MTTETTSTTIVNLSDNQAWAMQHAGLTTGWECYQRGTVKELHDWSERLLAAAEQVDDSRGANDAKHQRRCLRAASTRFLNAADRLSASEQRQREEQQRLREREASDEAALVELWGPDHASMGDSQKVRVLLERGRDDEVIDAPFMVSAVREVIEPLLIACYEELTRAAHAATVARVEGRAKLRAAGHDDEVVEGWRGHDTLSYDVQRALSDLTWVLQEKAKEAISETTS